MVEELMSLILDHNLPDYEKLSIKQLDMIERELGEVDCDEYMTAFNLLAEQFYEEQMIEDSLSEWRGD